MTFPSAPVNLSSFCIFVAVFKLVLCVSLYAKMPFHRVKASLRRFPQAKAKAAVRKVSRAPRKLLNTLTKLRKLPLTQQHRQLQLANGKFVKDLSSAARKVRYAKVKLAPTVRKKLTQHRKALQTFVNPRTSLRKKKQVLTQRGGIIPALIPIIVAAIGATGTVGAAATHAAISKS